MEIDPEFAPSGMFAVPSLMPEDCTGCFYAVYFGGQFECLLPKKYDRTSVAPCIGIYRPDGVSVIFRPASERIPKD